MPINVPFGPVTVNPGSRIFGPATANNADSRCTLTIDRTITGGLNALTIDSIIKVLVEMSTDGGANWHATDTDQMGTETAWTTVGGPATFTDKAGVPHVFTQSSGTWPLFPGTGRQLRATVTIFGSVAIAVSGSLVTA